MKTQGWKIHIVVNAMVPIEKLDPEDRRAKVAREHTYVVMAGSSESAEESALDTFHSNVPIACLDDFDIRVWRVEHYPSVPGLLLYLDNRYEQRLLDCIKRLSGPEDEDQQPAKYTIMELLSEVGLNKASAAWKKYLDLEMLHSASDKEETACRKSST